jgi:hypothetical protein
MAHLIAVKLCGFELMLQATILVCELFDPFSLLQTAESFLITLRLIQFFNQQLTSQISSQAGSGDQT